MDIEQLQPFFEGVKVGACADWAGQAAAGPRRAAACRQLCRARRDATPL
jgi:hypothetical protein